jgi:hypothetical protein
MVVSSIVMSAIIQGAFKLTLAATAIVVARLTLKWLDWSIEDDSFQQTLKTAEPHSKMLYFAARFLGVCLIIGLAIS